MKLAVSNRTLPAINHLHLLPAIAEMGVEGLEIAPARTWPDTWHELTSQAVAFYGRVARNAGLSIIGLHALLDNKPELGLFMDKEARWRTINYLVHLSSVCRDLGGRTLIFGSRWRSGFGESDAWKEFREFLFELLPCLEPHGTKLCFSPLSPDEGDFCAKVAQCRMLTYALDDHPSLGLHVAANALMANGEMRHATFAGIRNWLDHVHIDEPGLAVIGSSGKVDHADHRRHLAGITYDGWISVVQRHIEGSDAIEMLRQGVRFAEKAYLPVDTRRSSFDDRRQTVQEFWAAG